MKMKVKPPPPAKKTGAELIAIERAEHLSKHGIRVIDDVARNSGGELKDAIVKLTRRVQGMVWPLAWRNKPITVQMDAKTEKQRAIAIGALAAAEYDRLDLLYPDQP